MEIFRLHVFAICTKFAKPWLKAFSCIQLIFIIKSLTFCLQIINSFILFKEVELTLSEEQLFNRKFVINDFNRQEKFVRSKLHWRRFDLCKYLRWILSVCLKQYLWALNKLLRTINKSFVGKFLLMQASIIFIFSSGVRAQLMQKSNKRFIGQFIVGFEHRRLNLVERYTIKSIKSFQWSISYYKS